MENNINFSEEEKEVLNCLNARMSGVHIEEANQYIAKLEVIIYIYYFIL